ncbi:MAG: DUF1329 domain-containing protein [bacterium]
MRKDTFLGVLAVVLGVAAFASLTASAEIAPGDVIDRENWQKAEGLLPAPVLDWVKKGDVIRVGELPYDPGEYLPPGCLATLTSNVGKYDVNDKGILVDAKTGRLPDLVEGFPFPAIDLNDARAGEKIMYNKFYYNYACGNMRVGVEVAKWIGRHGYEREIEFESLGYPMDGYAGVKGEPNPDNIETYVIFRVLGPVDVRGTNVLTWRFRDERQDHTFTYVPAIRRVRRMSPANRSDAFLGSDFCVDDNWGYGGKVNAFEWKVLGKQEQLVPYHPGPPVPIRKNEKGEWVVQTRPADGHMYGWQQKDYPGAPWFPTNVAWVPRPVYAMEIKARDPYYNYGIQYLWVDAEIFQPAFKVIHDRSGNYWKVEWQIQVGHENEDKSIRMVGLADMIAVDDRTDHGTVILTYDPKCMVRFFAVMDKNDFSLAGFQKLCK